VPRQGVIGVAAVRRGLFVSGGAGERGVSRPRLVIMRGQAEARAWLRHGQSGGKVFVRLCSSADAGERDMETELATWHFIVAGIIFVVLGALAHVVRAVFNVFPDKLSDTPAVNVLVSSDYSWGDYLIGTEFDDGGYYRLDSLKNLRLSVTYWLIAGFGMMLISAEAAQMVAYGIEAGLSAFVDLFWYRIENLKA
jgi:hypothetical protein